MCFLCQSISPLSISINHGGARVGGRRFDCASNSPSYRDEHPENRRYLQGDLRRRHLTDSVFQSDIGCHRPCRRMAIAPPGPIVSYRLSGLHSGQNPVRQAGDHQGDLPGSNVVIDFLNAGAKLFVAKSYQSSELLHCIKQLLPSQKQRLPPYRLSNGRNWALELTGTSLQPNRLAPNN